MACHSSHNSNLHTDIQTYRHTDIQTYRHTDIQKMALYHNLFGEESHPVIYEKPKTTQDRIRERDAKIQKKVENSSLKPFNPANFNLSSFPKDEIRSVFCGQNIYVRPSYLVSIAEYCFFNSQTGEISVNPAYLSDRFKANQSNLLDNDQNGRLSKKAISNLRNCINWLCISAKKKRVYVKSKGSEFHFKVNFVTLTLPDTPTPISSVDLQKKLLNPFLTYMRKFHGLRNYVWRLEFQANGKLHAHMSADTFLHHQVIRDAWNRLLDKNGYLDSFFKTEGHKNPNSTDVHATRKIKNMAAYIAKYMSKQGAEYKYPLKVIQDRINTAVSIGLPEKEIQKLIAIKSKMEKSKPKKWHALDRKRWYIQRVNFWNSPFNPRPITGRIWGCSVELSKASKSVVHIPANECSHELRCLMNKELQFKELTFTPPAKDLLLSQDQPQARKIGEMYFLKSGDWFTKINGKIRRSFEQTRSNISALNNNLTFELE